MSTSEELRRRYRYRDLILRGKLRVSLDAAKRLIGPDCAYHLYRTVDYGEEVVRTNGSVSVEHTADTGPQDAQPHRG